MRSALLYSLLGASLLANAHPSAKPGNNVQRRIVDLKSLRVNTNSQYFNHKASKADQSLKLLKRESYVETATELVKRVTPNAEFRLAKDHYIGANCVAHVYFRQTVNGLDVGNANFNVNVSIPMRNEFGPYRLIQYRLAPTAASCPMDTRSIREKFQKRVLSRSQCFLTLLKLFPRL